MKTGQPYTFCLMSSCCYLCLEKTPGGSVEVSIMCVMHREKCYHQGTSFKRGSKLPPSVGQKVGKTSSVCLTKSEKLWLNVVN